MEAGADYQKGVQRAYEMIDEFKNYTQRGSMKALFAIYSNNVKNMYKFFNSLRVLFFEIFCMVPAK
jgi:hypothetical protein